MSPATLVRRGGLVGSAVLIVVLLATACASPAGTGGTGGGDSAEAGGDAGGDTGSAAPIRLGYSAWPGWFPWRVAQEQGLFAERGLTVDLTYFESYTDSLNALASGRLDANSQTLNDTIASVAAGADQVIVLVNDNSTGNDQIIAGEGITSAADLAGKQVAVEFGTVDHFLLLLGLDEAGVDADEVDLQPLETGAAAAAFASDAVDAVGLFAPFTTTALQRPGANVLWTSKDFPGAIPDHLVVSGELRDARGDDVAALVDVWFDALEFIEQNPDDAIAIMAEQAGVTAQEYAEYDAGTTLFSREDNVTAFGPGTDFTSLEFAAREISDFLVRSELIDMAPALDGLFDDRFVRASQGQS